MAEEEKGFTVRDRRRVKADDASADTEEKAPAGGHGKQEEHNQTYQRTAEGSGALPPVDFAGFALGLGQMALMHLGEFPEPQTGQFSRNLEQARHTIDILDMLDEKTRGNLTSEESNLLRALKSELKLKYVKAASGAKTG